jgi:tripartite ATP-independent transporter DctM subunit
MEASLQTGVIVGLILFFILLVMGVEIAWVFIISGSVTFLLIGAGLGEMARVVYHGMDKDVLMAVGYFILGGALISRGGIADHLVRWVNDFVGHLRGGLAAVAIVSSLLFGALTGSGLTSVAALGPLLVDRMERYGYMRSYSIGVICASGFMGHLIPPSIPLMIYALLSDQSVAALFASTIIPGVILALLYMVVNFVFVKRLMIPADAGVTVGTETSNWLRTTIRHTGAAFPALLFPIVIVGGIYGGVFTPTEAAAVACVYATVIGFLVYRGLTAKGLYASLKEAMGTTGMLLLLVGTGMFFSRVLVRVGMAEIMTESILGISPSTVIILLALNLLLLLLGMFMDTMCLLVIVVPLLVPLFRAIDMNLIHAGAMVVLNIGIGMVTPPFAASLFVGARVADVPVHRLAKPAMLFVSLGAIPVLFLTTFVPELSLWLPSILVGPQIVGIGS